MARPAIEFPPYDRCKWSNQKELFIFRMSTYRKYLYCFVVLLAIASGGGCYAPMSSPGIPAATLDDSFRIPFKSQSFGVNFASLTRNIPEQYLLGPGDLVRIRISELVPFDQRNASGFDGSSTFAASQTSTLDLEVSKQGSVLLPLVGHVEIDGLTVDMARRRMVSVYANGFLDDPKISVILLEKRTVGIMVLGGVANPGYFRLPEYEADIAHAIASAGGMLPLQDEIQVHQRRVKPSGQGAISTASHVLERAVMPQAPQGYLGPPKNELSVLQIPLRNSGQTHISPQQAELADGDIVMVRKFPDQVFFVVGKLSAISQVRFSTGNGNRDLGNGFVLPPDRDIDVVTAVAMAGYIDPIDSPTTVAVHRTGKDGSPLLIKVDLIAARFNRLENVMVQPGDIIYLNPDSAWWMRRTLDRMVPALISRPYSELMQRLIDPRGLN